MITTFLKPSYWLSFDFAIVDGVGGRVVFAGFLVLLLIGIFSRIVAVHKTEDRYMKEAGLRFATLFITMGLLGLMFFFFSFEHIRFFGARFWYLLWLIGSVTWFVFLVRFVKKEIPYKRARDLERVAKLKYMPKKKKKK